MVIIFAVAVVEFIRRRIIFRRFNNILTEIRQNILRQPGQQHHEEQEQVAKRPQRRIRDCPEKILRRSQRIRRFDIGI